MTKKAEEPDWEWELRRLAGSYQGKTIEELSQLYFLEQIEKHAARGYIHEPNETLQ